MLKFLISSLFIFSISVFAQTIDLDVTIRKSDNIQFTFDDVKNFINITADHDILAIKYSLLVKINIKNG